MVNREPLYCLPLSSLPSFITFADPFSFHSALLPLPFPLRWLSLFLFLFLSLLNLVLFFPSPFCRRVVHDSFESASPRGPGIDSRLSRRLLLPWRPSCNQHWFHYITSHFIASCLHTYVQPCAHILGLYRLGSRWAFPLRCSYEPTHYCREILVQLEGNTM